MEAIGKLTVAALGLARGLLAGLFQAFVATQLWAWFAVPLGAPPVPVGAAWGLLLLVDLVQFRYLCAEQAARQGQGSKQAAIAVGMTVTQALVIWGLGAALHAVLGGA